MADRCSCIVLSDADFNSRCLSNEKGFITISITAIYITSMYIPTIYITNIYITTIYIYRRLFKFVVAII